MLLIMILIPSFVLAFLIVYYIVNISLDNMFDNVIDFRMYEEEINIPKGDETKNDTDNESRDEEK